MKTRLLSLFVALLATTALWAYDLKFGNLYYNILTDSTVGVVRDDSYASLTTVTIPSTFSHNGTVYTVTEIKYWAFKECAELTSVTIPGSVTYIGGSAFADCTGLTSVNISHGLTTIGGGAFYNCTSLTSVTIPSSVTYIEGSAFAGCSSLATITIPNSVTNIGQDAFEGTPWYENQPDGAIYINNMLYNYKGTMPSKTSITVKEGTVSICQYAFYEQITLVSITFPNSLKSIGKCAFAYCNGLTSITIPNGVTTIGEQAFRSCDFLTSITIPNSVTSIEEEAFYSCRRLTSITIPNSITTIGIRVFEDCRGLTSVSIPNSVTSIESTAFGNCTGLTSIVIPSSVTSIGNWAFKECTSLASVSIPSSVTSVGEYAFKGTPWFENHPTGVVYINNMLYAYNGTMPSNTSIAVKAGTVSICQGAFRGCTGLTSITIPDGVTTIGLWAFRDCKGLESITIANTVTSIGNWAFLNCTGLTSVTIPNGMKSIGNNIFDGCTGLTSVTIPNSVTSIGIAAFSGCRRLTSLTLPDSLIWIGGGAFSGCTGLTSVTLPNSLIWIGGETFSKCTGLTSITIPSKVTSIGDWAFADCTGLTSMTICAETPPTIYSETYKNVPTNVVMYIPCGKRNTYAAAEWWNLLSNYTETMTATVSLKSQDNDQGTVVMKKQATTCEDNTAIIEAIAKENYRFARWSDGNTDNPRTIIVTGDTTYTAEFGSNLCTITVIYDNMKGAVTGTGNYTIGTQVCLEATPNSGYEFVKWSDGKTYNPYKFPATGDLTLEAEFRSTTAVENVSADTPAPRKIFRNGQVLILREGKTFTTTGVEVK